MLRSARSGFICSLLVAGACDCAQAGFIAYDNLSGQSSAGWVDLGAVRRVADDTELLGPGLTIRAVEVGLRTGSAFRGWLTVSIYDAARGMPTPETLLAETPARLDLPGDIDLTATVLLPDVVAPGTRLWTVWTLSRNERSGPTRVLLGFGGAPSLGTSTPTALVDDHGSWTSVGTPAAPVNHQVRITAVPSTGSLSLLVLAGLVATGPLRRRAQG